MGVGKNLAQDTNAFHHSAVMTGVFRFFTVLGYCFKLPFLQPDRLAHSLLSTTINSASLPVIPASHRSFVRVQRKEYLRHFNIAECPRFFHSITRFYLPLFSQGTIDQPANNQSSLLPPIHTSHLYTALSYPPAHFTDTHFLQ